MFGNCEAFNCRLCALLTNTSYWTSEDRGNANKIVRVYKNILVLVNIKIILSSVTIMKIYLGVVASALSRAERNVECPTSRACRIRGKFLGYTSGVRKNAKLWYAGRGWNSKDSERLLRPARRQASAPRRAIERRGCLPRWSHCSRGTTLKRECELTPLSASPCRGHALVSS